MKTVYVKDVEKFVEDYLREHNLSKNEFRYFVGEEKKSFFGLKRETELRYYVINQEIVSEAIKHYLDKVFEPLNINHQYISIEAISREKYKVVLATDKDAFIIGKHGANLKAITVLLMLHLRTHFPKDYIEVLIDINDYKEDRYKFLRQRTLKLAKEVQKTKITVTLDAMTNDERKEVHKYLANMVRVRTVSVGEGKNRRLTIVYDPNKR